MRIENRINESETKKLFLCLLEQRMWGALGHITFWRVRSNRRCAAQNTSLCFPKCFIDFRAIYRPSERRYSYQKAEHFYSVAVLLFNCMYTNKKCPASQDTAYILLVAQCAQRACATHTFTEVNLHRAIGTSVLVSELTDTLSLDYKARLLSHAH